MTDIAHLKPGSAMDAGTILRKPDLSESRIRRRYAAERRFKFFGQLAVALAIGMLGLMLFTIVKNGWTAFYQTQIALDITFDAATIDPTGARDPEVLRAADWQALVKNALKTQFPEVTDRADRRKLYSIVSSAAGEALMKMAMSDPSLIGQTKRVTLPANDDIDMLHKGFISGAVAEADRVVDDKEIAWFDKLSAAGQVTSGFNTSFLVNGDSREPEQAGILGALMGSVYTMIVTLVMALPLGVLSAVYLEEFAPKNKFTDLIEVNINNLAAVPSVVFGLLGLALFLGVFGMPRSAPLVGGMVLMLMTLPTIIIATRAALKAVPPSIREAAYGVGASPLQVVSHHVVPLAMPGIMTGAIIGMARALGESAPLLMIGMVAFIVDVPKGITDAATVLPVQIYLWADASERAFVEKTSAGIIVLLFFLILMNAVAIYVRRKFERRW
jgi:phosphate transport system permease protein